MIRYSKIQHGSRIVSENCQDLETGISLDLMIAGEGVHPARYNHICQHDPFKHNSIKVLFSNFIRTGAQS